MTKEEARSSVMGAISMALKDPTLQQGFEIICKNLSELEAYNEKLLNSDIEKHNKIVLLKAQIEKMKCCQNCKHSDIGCQGHTICGNGHFFDCLSNNNFFNHQTSDVDYWEIKEK